MEAYVEDLLKLARLHHDSPCCVNPLALHGEYLLLAAHDGRIVILRTLRTILAYNVRFV